MMWRVFLGFADGAGAGSVEVWAVCMGAPVIEARLDPVYPAGA